MLQYIVSRDVEDSKLNAFGRYAIADASAQALYRGPDQVSEQIKPLVDGVKLEILDQDGDWYKVATLNKEQGWIPKADVRLLSF